MIYGDSSVESGGLSSSSSDMNGVDEAGECGDVGRSGSWVSAGMSAAREVSYAMTVRSIWRKMIMKSRVSK